MKPRWLRVGFLLHKLLLQGGFVAFALSLLLTPAFAGRELSAEQTNITVRDHIAPNWYTTNSELEVSRGVNCDYIGLDKFVAVTSYDTAPGIGSLVASFACANREASSTRSLVELGIRLQI